MRRAAAERAHAGARSAREVLGVGAQVAVGLAALWWDEVRLTRTDRAASPVDGTPPA